MRSRIRSGPKSDTSIYFLIVFPCCLAISHKPQTSHDIWWHLQIGEDICRTLSLPHRDTYSYTVAGTPFCLHSWLSDTFFYLFSQKFGESPLYILPTVVHTFFGMAVFFIALTHSAQPVAAMIVAVLSCFLVHAREIRPYIFDEMFGVLLYRLIGGHTGLSKWRMALGTFFFYAAWTNLHGTAPAFALLTATALLAEAVAARWSSVHNFPLTSRNLSVLGIAGCAAVLGVVLLSYGLCFFKYEHDEWCSREPEGIMAFWNRNGLTGNVFTHPVWAGFVIWRSNKTAKIFSDTRIEPFTSENWIRQNMEIYQDLTSHLTYLSAIGTTHILVPTSYHALRLLVSHSRLVPEFQSPYAVLFSIRRSPGDDEPLGRLPLPTNSAAPENSPTPPS